MNSDQEQKDREEIRSAQMQWLFVVIASLLAVTVGIFANALYDFLLESHSRLFILIFSALVSLLLIDVFNYFFENLHKIKEDQFKSFKSFLLGYIKFRFKIKK